MVNRPKKFEFKVELRSPHHADLLRRIEAEQKPEISDARLLNIGGGKRREGRYVFAVTLAN